MEVFAALADPNVVGRLKAMDRLEQRGSSAHQSVERALSESTKDHVRVAVVNQIEAFTQFGSMFSSTA